MALSNWPTRRKHRGKKMAASEAIQACNILIWKCMFPPEKGFSLDFGSDQHKTMILCFMAGILAAEGGCAEPSMEALHDEFCDPNWQPDDRFRPTSHANN